MRAMVFLVALGVASPAAASGGLSCSVDDGKATFEIESGVTRGMGSPVFNFRGTLDIADERLAADLRHSAFTGENLTQYWLDGSRLNLRLYRERVEGPHASIDLVVLTESSDDESGYSGSYTVSVGDLIGDNVPEPLEIEITGAVECFVE